MLDKELNTSFLESYSQNFARQTTDSFFNRQAHITGKEITSFCDIMQVNLLVLDGLFGNWQQETSRLRSPYFDFGAAEVTEALEQFMNTLSRYIKVDREHFAPLAASAAAQTLRLTLKPYDYFRDTFRQMTLQPIALETIKSRLKFFQINKLLLQETVQRLESEGIEEVSADSLMIVFDGVYASRQGDLEKADTLVEAFSRYVPLQLPDLEAAPAKPQTRQSFWVDIEQFASAANQPQQMVAPVTVPVLNTQSGITPLPTGPPPAQPELPTPEPAHPMPINPEPLNPQPVNPIPVNPAPVNPEPVKVPPVNVILNENFRKEKETLNDRFRGNTADTLAEKHRKQRVDNLRSAISLNQRFLFVKGLFRGDSAAFHQALNDLEQCPDFPSAVQMLQNKYGTTYGWSRESEEYQDFIDLIERKF